MTLAAQQTALAKHLGLDRQFVLMKRGYYYRVNAAGYTDQLSEAWRVNEVEAKKHARSGQEPVTMHPLPWPDWAGDLNAMREVELTLTDHQHKQFRQHLILAAVEESNRLIAWSRIETSPSAAQRLEALLRTLSLWDDSL